MRDTWMNAPVILLFIYPSMWIPGLQLPKQTMLDSLPLIDEGDYEHKD